MKPREQGFGLIELMLALTLGLLMSLALVQAFLGSKATYVSQRASANLQEDARFVLNKLAQDIRMVGTFGCLAAVKDGSATGDFAAAFDTPIRWVPDSQQLQLITSGVDSAQDPEWLIYTDCSTQATAYSAGNASGVQDMGAFRFAVQRQHYVFRPETTELALNGEALISNVSAFTVLFGVARAANERSVSSYVPLPADPALIRSVRITLTLSDPDDRVRAQSFSVVAALRNRLG
jgi:type IV pilus assembly protein PilW